jgi:hypothetical protein
MAWGDDDERDDDADEEDEEKERFVQPNDNIVCESLAIDRNCC